MANNMLDLKKLLKPILFILIVVLLVRWCTSSLGSVITLPGGSGSGSDGSGGWFNPKEKTNDGSTVNDVTLDIKDLERELGIGTEKNQSPTINVPSSTSTTSTSTSSAPLSFKGIPMTGSLSAFGQELVKAGFRSAGNGTYVGDFAGYSGCKITPTGSNPVQEVRIDFPVISNWEALEKAYDSLQASLTQKYGMEPKVNRNIAVYDLPNGSITLDADVANQSTWHVIMKYTNNPSITLDTSSGRNPIDDL